MNASNALKSIAHRGSLEETLSIHAGSTGSSRSGLQSRRIGLAFVVALLALGCVWSSAAQAEPLRVASFSAGAFNADGTPSTQAGAHPYELSSSLVFNTVFDSRFGYEVPAESLKDTVVNLPPGVLGDPHAMPQCRTELLAIPSGRCPSSTQIGIAQIELQFQAPREVKQVPIYNMVPPAGEPAQFAFLIVASIARIDVKVRSDGDYGVTATVHNTNPTAPVWGVKVHLWGVPADPAHDPERYRFSDAGGPGDEFGHPISTGVARKPMFRNPTSCTGPVTTAVRITSWQEPELVSSASAEAPGGTGCSHVPFAPTVVTTPDVRRAAAPAGIAVDLNLPQNESPNGLATADLRRAVVTLPSGVALNPGSADGLQSCTDAQFGIHSTEPDACPIASKIGTMQITTPVLDNPLEGSIYLGQPLDQSPAAAAAGDMFRVFLEAHGTGVQVKLAGSVVPDPVTGQLTTTFDNNPQLPFSNAHLDFKTGPRAPLVMPKACGTYTTRSELTSWASNTPVADESSFTVDQGCEQAARFEPSLSAGLTNPVAGGFAPFTMTLSRPDGQQDLGGLQLTLPPGLAGYVGSVPLCPDAQAAAGTCSSASQIGRVATAAGAGSSPLWTPQPGKTPTAVFLAGPYKGAPFSLSVVVPAQAGPFDLGTVVVRVALFIDKHDAHVSVVSDPLPTILDGVPLNLQTVNVTIDRPRFMVAPTNCGPMRISGSASSTTGAKAGLASHFQVGGCAALKFTPKFAFSALGKPSRQLGTGLTAKISYPSGSVGKQANIAKVKVTLPRQFPSRLKTLQQACIARVFEANPAACPAHSIVGKAVVRTPLLSVPLTGPAYFVSHGGEAFPSLTMVLQGEGVTIELVGSTLIQKGITSTTFKTTPDVPFSSFELTLPQGEYSALGVNLPDKAHGSLCGQHLKMPTEAIAQNGLEIHQSTPIAVTGCKGKAAKGARHAKKSAQARK